MAEPKVVNAHRAQSLGTYTPGPVTITIHDQLPERDSYVGRDQQAVEMDQQAIELAEALHASLPGRTFDALVAELLRRKASLLRVAYREVPDAAR